MSLQKYSKGGQQERKDRQNAMRQKINLKIAAGSPHLPDKTDPTLQSKTQGVEHIQTCCSYVLSTIDSL
jgi:hypothetical protein